MKRSSVFKITFLSAAVLLLALAAWWFLGRGRGVDSDDTPSKDAPAQVTQTDGRPIVAIDQAGQTTSGIVAITPRALTHRPVLQTFGTVLDLSDLVALRAKLVSSQADSQRAKAALSASAAEYRRLDALHKGRHDVSDKTLQAAEAIWHGDEASLRAAKAATDGVRLAAEQQWGKTIAQAVIEDAPLFEKLIQHKQILLQILLPAGTQLSPPPRTLRVQTTGDRIHAAEFAAASPRVDPRLQGSSLFYTAQAQDLLPGMTLTAYVPTGQSTDGVVIPSSSIVWLQGKAWAYARIEPGHFERFELTLDNPMDDGWFVSKGFARGAPVVSTGAQLLLSEEQRSKISSGGDGDDE